jgi:hypothetical protein
MNSGLPSGHFNKFHEHCTALSVCVSLQKSEAMKNLRLRDQGHFSVSGFAIKFASLWFANKQPWTNLRLSRHFRGGSQENHKSVPGKAIFTTVLETRTSRIRSRVANRGRHNLSFVSNYAMICLFSLKSEVCTLVKSILFSGCHRVVLRKLIKVLQLLVASILPCIYCIDDTFLRNVGNHPPICYY